MKKEDIIKALEKENKKDIINLIANGIDEEKKMAIKITDLENQMEKAKNCTLLDMKEIDDLTKENKELKKDYKDLEEFSNELYRKYKALLNTKTK